MVGVGVAALAISGGGIAYATGVFSSALPGETVTTTLGTAVTGTETGSQTLNLGPRPVKADGVSISLDCLSVGTFVYPDGASESCDSPRDVRQALTEPPYGVRLDPGQSTITIKTAPGARWRVSASYITLTGTARKVNASGETYGVEKQQGSPDLIAVQATNHRQGYAYASQLQRAANGGGPPPTTTQQALAESKHGAVTTPVYESDGKTRIGTFTTGN